MSAKDVMKEVAVIDEEGFVDFEFPLVRAGQGDDGSWLLSARGLLHESTMGFDVRLDPEWRAQDIEAGELTIFWGTGAIVRSGAESDQFCGLLQDKYQLSGNSREMPSQVQTTVVSLGTDPARITEEPVRMKMFLEPEGDDGEYAEFFLNVDLPGRVVQFNEKDNEYRENLVKALCR